MRDARGWRPWLIVPLIAACAGQPSAPSPAEDPDPLSGSSIPRCADIPPISAPADRYRDSPIYVANEQPTEVLRAWARTKPGFEELWIDRDHLGWVTLAFSQDADARQAELERQFPGVGAVVVGVTWTTAELEALQARAVQLMPRIAQTSGTYAMQGVVGIGVGVLEPQRLAAVEALFAGERVCVEGVDPAAVPADGPQAAQGDGWRLLADERDIGEAYRTGIATDAESYRRLWAEIGLPGQPPAVDFDAEIVVWFGAVYGSSCPDLRLDDVVVDRANGLLHAEIVLVGAPMACTDDARPHAYVVAVRRDRLPAGGFGIQLGADDPPAGVPEERTVVEADLSIPGAVAGPGDVHGDPALPSPEILESGAVIEPGFPVRYRMSVHCGTEWLGQLNSIWWRTDVPQDSSVFFPEAWSPMIDSADRVEVSVLLHEGPQPFVEATANGRTLVYQASLEPAPGCD